MDLVITQGDKLHRAWKRQAQEETQGKVDSMPRDPPNSVPYSMITKISEKTTTESIQWSPKLVTRSVLEIAGTGRHQKYQQEQGDNQEHGNIIHVDRVRCSGIGKVIGLAKTK